MNRLFVLVSEKIGYYLYIYIFDTDCGTWLQRNVNSIQISNELKSIHKLKFRDMQQSELR